MISAPYSKRLACLLLTLGLLALNSCSSTQLAIDQGIPWELAEHRSKTIYDLRYHFALDIPLSRTEAITGKSRIGLNWNDRSAQPLVIDFLLPQQRIHSVLVNGIEANWQPVNDHIVIPASALIPGENSIDLAFDAGDEIWLVLEHADEGQPQDKLPWCFFSGWPFCGRSQVATPLKVFKKR